MFKIEKSKDNGIITDESVLTLTNVSENNSPGNTSNHSSLSTWAEDAIKQNQDLWDSVERQFYGEDPLPEDKALRNDIIEWNRIFPHLRVSGKPVEFHYSHAVKPANPSHCEVLEPASRSALARQDYLASGLEECLIIRPGASCEPSPAVQRRNATIYKQLDNQLTTTISAKAVRSNALVEKIKMIELDKDGKETINTVFYRTYEPIATFEAEGGPDKNEPEFNVFFNRNPWRPMKPRFKSSVTLPNIDSPPTSMLAGVVGRSISAKNSPIRKHVKMKSIPMPGLFGEAVVHE